MSIQQRSMKYVEALIEESIDASNTGDTTLDPSLIEIRYRLNAWYSRKETNNGQ